LTVLESGSVNDWSRVDRSSSSLWASLTKNSGDTLLELLDAIPSCPARPASPTRLLIRLVLLEFSGANVVTAV
jgi:hypothetical protein